MAVDTNLRTQISRDQYAGNEVIWFSDLHTIDEIINDFKLPVLVKVVDGYMINELECIESNTIFSVHGCRHMAKLKAFDRSKRPMRIPVTCNNRVAVMPCSPMPLCRTIGDVCKHSKLPGYITNAVEFKSGNVTFPPGTTFAVKSIVKSGNEAKALSVICSGGTGEQLSLSTTLVGGFSETVSPADRRNTYLIGDLLKRKLPLAVEFQPSNEKNSAFSPRIGTVTLVDFVPADVVYASRYIDGRRSLTTFSRGLNINLQIGRVIFVEEEETYSTIAEPNEEPIDERVLHYALHLDPYSGDFANVDYDEVMEKIKQKQVHCDANRQAEMLKDEREKEKPPEIPKRAKRAPAKPFTVRSHGIEDTKKGHHEGIPERGVNQGVAVRKGVENDALYEAVANSVPSVENMYMSGPKPAPTAPPRMHSKPVKPARSTSTEKCPDDKRNLNAITFSLPLNAAASFSYPSTAAAKVKGRPPLLLPKEALKDEKPSMNHANSPGTYEEVPTAKKMSFHIPKKSEIRNIPCQGYEDMSLHKNPSLALDSSSSSKLASTGGKTANQVHGKAILNAGLQVVEKDSFLHTWQANECKIDTVRIVGEAIGETNEDRECSILRELANKDVDGICEILKQLQMEDYVDDFIDNQIDGELLIDIKEDDLQVDINMTLFEARKICTYRTGWRPDECSNDLTPSLSGGDGKQDAGGVDVPAESWRVGQVCDRMKTIRLHSFAEFCKKNQVNGSLLEKLLDRDVLNSIRKDYNISLSNIEETKLKNYVIKGWRHRVNSESKKDTNKPKNDE